MKLQKMRLTNASVFAYPSVNDKKDYRWTERKPTPVRLRVYWRQRRVIKELEKLLEQNVQLELLQEAVWSALVLYQNYPFQTSKGLGYSYKIKGNEIFFSRKDKSITRATFNLAIQNALELNRVVSGPKMLGCFGASYLYPVLLRLTIIKKI